MTFYEYMTRYLGVDSPEGDFATDLKRDRDEFPTYIDADEEDGHKIIMNHLVRKHACGECIKVFKECWEEYAESEGYYDDYNYEDDEDEDEYELREEDE